MSVEVDGLNIVLGGKSLVHDVSLRLGDRERVGLIGASGSGKSMIAKAMLGLLPVHAKVSGSIRVQGIEIVGASETDAADMRGRFASMVFQNPAASLHPLYTAKQQVMLPLQLHYELSKAECAERALHMLEKVGVSAELAGKYPHELSGGQQQRVGIASALVTSPQLIIADEPTTALDSITQRNIVDLLIALVDDAGASLLFITHDFSVLSRASQRCYVLENGRVVESGSTEAMLLDPQTSQAAELVSAARMLTFNSHEGGE